MQKASSTLVNIINKVASPYSLDTLEPTEHLLPPDADGVRVGNDVEGSVACSAAVTGVVDGEGHLRCFGVNQFGQCGVGQESNHVWLATPVVLESAVEAMKSINQAQGQRGSEAAVAPPLADLAGERCRQVSLGFQHGLAVTDGGRVYAWGTGERGQLGDGAAENTVGAVRVWGLGPVREGEMATQYKQFVPKGIEAGGEAGGKGGGKGGGGKGGGKSGKGKRGSSEKRRGQKAEEEMERARSPVVSIDSGFNHNAALTEAGDLYVWGKFQSDVVVEEQQEGAARIGRAFGDQQAPRRLPSTGAPIVQVCCSYVVRWFAGSKGVDCVDYVDYGSATSHLTVAFCHSPIKQTAHLANTGIVLFRPIFLSLLPLSLPIPIPIPISYSFHIRCTVLVRTVPHGEKRREEKRTCPVIYTSVCKSCMWCCGVYS
jgi:hypothetical protein